MELTEKQQRTIIDIVNAFETGGKYDKVATERDGDNNRHQISYGVAQVTEYGKLRQLLSRYIYKGGKYSYRLAPYMAKVGVEPLVGDLNFIQILKDAGKYDPIMREVQDGFFYTDYFKPALDWATATQFRDPLSMLVIYDSFIHSGGIHGFLRKRFAERVPVEGGNERKWIQAYVEARHKWLGTHTKTILQKTIYRTRLFQDLINDKNWYLAKLPIYANGHKIK